MCSIFFCDIQESIVRSRYLQLAALRQYKVCLRKIYLIWYYEKSLQYKDPIFLKKAGFLCPFLSWIVLANSQQTNTWQDKNVQKSFFLEVHVGLTGKVLPDFSSWDFTFKLSCLGASYLSNSSKIFKGESPQIPLIMHAKISWSLGMIKSYLSLPPLSLSLA